MKVKDINQALYFPPLKAKALKFLREASPDEVYTLVELAAIVTAHPASLRPYTPSAEFAALRMEVSGRHFYGSQAAIRQLRGKLENK